MNRVMKIKPLLKSINNQHKLLKKLKIKMKLLEKKVQLYKMLVRDYHRNYMQVTIMVLIYKKMSIYLNKLILLTFQILHYQMMNTIVMQETTMKIQNNIKLMMLKLQRIRKSNNKKLIKIMQLNLSLMMMMMMRIIIVKRRNGVIILYYQMRNKKQRN